MAAPHVDRPGVVHFFAGRGPATVLNNCPHAACPHNAQEVIAWGPDLRRYELVVCDVDDGCAGRCRGWTDEREGGRRGGHGWKLVGAERPLPRSDRDIVVA